MKVRSVLHSRRSDSQGVLRFSIAAFLRPFGSILGPPLNSTLGLAAAVLLSCAGCQRGEIAFTPNNLEAVDAELVTLHREQIAQAMVATFGTPEVPRVPEGVGLDITKLTMAAGQPGYVRNSHGEKYQQRGLYRQHCASCHGITGNGMGPAASMLNPYPRDFRQGKFKFKSTYLSAKPTHEDLHRVVLNGVPGTAMPSFAVLDAQQIDALIEYVRYLSIRGQVERELIALVADEFDSNWSDDTTGDGFQPATDGDAAEMLDELVASVAKSWQQAEDNVVQPTVDFRELANRSEAEVHESAALGARLFVSSRAKCIDCHGSDGTARVGGSGSLQDQLKELDDWNRQADGFRRKTAALAEQLAEKKSQLAALPADQREQASKTLTAELRQLRRREQVVTALLPVQLARPRNLQGGVWRGGSEPLDLFYRVHQGIAGTPMPGHGSPRPGTAGALSEEEIVQLVDFLEAGAVPAASEL